MCSYINHHIGILSGSAKGPEGWIPVLEANVYFDHPYHAPLDHALTIDFLNPAKGAASRVAVEMDAASAKELAEAILNALKDGEREGMVLAATAR